MATTERGIKRRGILAAAGAAVAAIAARRAAEATPVAAVAPVTDTNFIATGSATNFDAQGTTSYGVDTFNGTFTYGVYGSGSGTGVYGYSPSGIGVIGYNSSATSSAVGVNGYASAGTGTLGQSTTGIGARGTGVYGVVGTVPNTANSIAVNATNTSTTGTGNLGVYGSCTSGYGILGVSSAGAPFSGITGAVTTATGAAFAGGASQPTAFAAYFTGKVNVDGPFYVNGVQRFTLKHADGTRRLVAGVQSPDPWVEEVGSGQLAGGVATVTLDADFAAIAETSDYLVFLTERGESNGLYVAAQTPTAFTVRERGGGTAGTSFYWRVVAKPKEAGGKVARLAKYEPPNITIPGVNGAPLPAVTLPPLPPPAPPPERQGTPPPNPAPPPRAAAPSVAAPPAAPAPAAATAAPGVPNPAPPPRS